MKLQDIKDPSFLKQMDIKELKEQSAFRHIGVQGMVAGDGPYSVAQRLSGNIIFLIRQSHESKTRGNANGAKALHTSSPM